MTWCDAPINVRDKSFCGELVFVLFVPLCGQTPKASEVMCLWQLQAGPAPGPIPSHPSSSLFTTISYYPSFLYALSGSPVEDLHPGCVNLLNRL